MPYAIRENKFPTSNRIGQVLLIVAAAICVLAYILDSLA